MKRIINPTVDELNAAYRAETSLKELMRCFMQHNWNTSGLHMFELIPIEGNELVCKLITYRWNGDGWSFQSLEAVYFKDSKTKENYIQKLLRKYNHD